MVSLPLSSLLEMTQMVNLSVSAGVEEVYRTLAVQVKAGHLKNCLCLIFQECSYFQPAPSPVTSICSSAKPLEGF